MNIKPTVQYSGPVNEAGSNTHESEFETGAGSSKAYAESDNNSVESPGPENENENDLQENIGTDMSEDAGDLREIRTSDDLDEPNLDDYIPNKEGE